jgi:hypothetical protein
MDASRLPGPLTPPEIAGLLRAAASALRDETRAQPERVLAWHPAPGEWCVKEVLGHLVETERRGFAGRIRTILAADRPRLEAWDQAGVARARGDCARALDVLLDEFLALREDSVHLVESLAPPDLARGGDHSTVGFLTVGDLLNEWVHHDRNHQGQITANVQAYVWPWMGNARRFSHPG